MAVGVAVEDGLERHDGGDDDSIDDGLSDRAHANLIACVTCDLNGFRSGCSMFLRRMQFIKPCALICLSPRSRADCAACIIHETRIAHCPCRLLSYPCCAASFLHARSPAATLTFPSLPRPAPRRKVPSADSHEVIWSLPLSVITSAFIQSPRSLPRRLHRRLLSAPRGRIEARDVWMAPQPQHQP